MGRHTSKNVVIALALVAAGGLVMTRRVVPWLVDRASYTDGSEVYTRTRGDGIRYAVWDHPEELPGDVNSPGHEARPTLSPDGRWMVFAVGDEGWNADLYIAEMRGGVPVDPRPLAALNTEADEIAPMFSEGADGLALYFASNRAGGEGGFDLYAAPFDGTSAGVAGPVGGAINTPADEVDPAPLGSPGLFDERFAWSEALIFASNRKGGGRGDFDLFLAQADPDADGAIAVHPLNELNSAGDEREPSFTRDARTLFFASNRTSSEDGSIPLVEPGYDVYRSVFEGGAWLPPAALEGLNTDASERAPFPSQDGFALYFQRDAPAGEGGERDGGNLHRARSIELFRLPPKPVGWLDLLLLGSLLLLALLAWLAKRWEQLDILYKCFLASLLAHLLLMWLLREVYPEGEVAPLGPGPDATFRVRVLANHAPTAGLRERGGALELARADEAELAEPDRANAEARTPTEDRSAPSVGRLTHSTADGPAPAPAPTEVARATAPDVRAPEFEDSPPPVERRRGTARAVALAAPEVNAERGETVTTEPARAAEAVAAQSPRAALTPSVVTVARSTNREQRSTRYAPASVAPVAVATAPRSGPSLQSPVETVERRASPAAAVAMPAPAPAAMAERPAERPDPLVASPSRLDRPTSSSAPGAESPTERTASLSLSRAKSTPLAPTRFTPASAQPSAPAAPAKARGPVLARPEEETGRRGEVRREEALALPEPSGLARERGTPTGPDAPRRVAVAASAARVEETPVPRMRPLAAERPVETRELPSAPARQEPAPYRSRFGSEKDVALETFGGGEDTERAVQQGLAYLASRQRSSGQWGDPSEFHAKYRQVGVGTTALATLAFLGAGHTHRSDSEYSPVVSRSLDWLLSMQDRRTGHFGNSSSYSHGVTTYALAECYALTRDQRLRRPIERAVAQILRHQVPRSYRGDPRLIGGWSYYYPDNATYDAWPRASITSWQVMALESARLGGIDVPEEALEDAENFLVQSWDPQLGAVRYSHDPSRLRSGYPTLPGSTPAALFALSIMGEDITGERFEAPREFVLRRLPDGYSSGGDDAFVFRAHGNLYFWYYGSLAMLRAGGDGWFRWNAALKETLLPAQESSGAWEPIDVYSRYAGDTRRDAIYTTAMCVLTLEVYYRYFTPLLEKD